MRFALRVDPLAWLGLLPEAPRTARLKLEVGTKQEWSKVRHTRTFGVSGSAANEYVQAIQPTLSNSHRSRKAHGHATKKHNSTHPDLAFTEQNATKKQWTVRRHDKRL